MNKERVKKADEWKEADSGGVLPPEVVEDIDRCGNGNETLARIDGQRLTFLCARAVDADISYLVRDTGERWRQRSVPVTLGASSNVTDTHVRMALGSSLLCIAGAQAFDPLVLPEVLVDHAGLKIGRASCRERGGQ